MSSADGGTVTWKTLVAEGRDVNEFNSLKIFSNFTIIFGLSGGFFSSFALAVLELGGEDIRVEKKSLIGRPARQTKNSPDLTL
jgi:hypothetical protein